MSERIFVLQRDLLRHHADITAVLPLNDGAHEQCARLLALNRQHDNENGHGQHRRNKQINSSQVIVGSARIKVAGRASVGIGDVVVERCYQPRVFGVEILLAQRRGAWAPVEARWG